MDCVPVGGDRCNHHAAIGQQVERWLTARRSWISTRDEMRQEAWNLCLRGAARFDPAHPGAGGWFFGLLDRAMGPRMTSLHFTVSLSERAAKSRDHRGDLALVRLRDEPGSTTPESWAATYQLALRIAKLREERRVLRLAIADQVMDGGVSTRFVGGDKRASIARTMKITPREVHRALASFTRAIARHPEMRRIEKQIAALEEEIRT